MPKSSKKVKSELAEEIASQIQKGEETFESCSRRYAQDWPRIKGQVQVYLLLKNQALRHKSQVKLVFDREEVGARLFSQLDQPQLKVGEGSNSASLSETVPLKELLSPPAADSGSAPPIQPSAGLRKPDRFQFLPSPPKEQKKRPGWFFSLGWQLKLVVAVVGFFLLGGLATWEVEASAPGDLFYGPKLGLEQASEVLAFSPQAKTEARLAYTERRLNEIQQALSQGRTSGLDEAVASYEAALNRANFEASPQEKEAVKERLLEKVQALAAWQATHPANPSPQVTRILRGLGQPSQPPTPPKSTSTPPPSASGVRITPGGVGNGKGVSTPPGQNENKERGGQDQGRTTPYPPTPQRPVTTPRAYTPPANANNPDPKPGPNSNPPGRRPVGNRLPGRERLEREKMSEGKGEGWQPPHNEQQGRTKPNQPPSFPPGPGPKEQAQPRPTPLSANSYQDQGQDRDSYRRSQNQQTNTRRWPYRGVGRNQHPG